MVYESPDGARMRFEPADEDGQWETPTGLRATLSGTGPFTLRFHQSGEEFEFDEGGSLTAHVDRSGNEIAYDYDGWELVAITDSHGRDVTIDYSGGFVDEVADHTGRTVDYDHDGEGNLTEVTDAAGETMTFAYDDDQRLTEVTDPRGTTTAIDYDADGRVVEVRRDDDGVLDDPVVWQWDHQSGETELTDPRGNATTYHHDGLGRVERVVDAVGRERTVEYDADSNVVALTGNAPGGTEGPETQLTYDDGRLVEVAQPSGATSTFTYQDANNRHAPDSYTNPQGSTVDYAYDEAGRLSAVVPRSDAGGDGYQVAHNDDGTIDSLTAPGGAVTDYVYDSGELTRIERPGPVGDETLDYDGLSRLVSRVDGNGDETTYAYDGLDRVVEVGFDDGGSVESEFDGNGNRVRQTDREDADDTEVRQFEFDELNRLVRETLPTGVNDYGYDPAGNLVSFEDPGGEVTYAYDAVSLPVEVTDPDGETIELSYDDDNLRKETVLPGGTVQSEDRDDDGNLTRIAAEDAAGDALTDLAYDYSSGGEPTALRQRLTDHVAGTETAYGYDGHDRLVSATETDTGTGEEVVSWGYGYDADSNLTELTVDGDTVTFTVNDAQQITASSDGESFAYDDAGQLLERDPGDGPATGYTYNRRGQTTEVDDPDAGQIEFAYAGEGQANRTEVGEATLHRSALGVTTIVPEDQPAASAHYTRLPTGEVLARRHATDGDRYYLVDALGSTVALVDSVGLVTNRYAYDPYGAVDETPLAGAVEQPWRYTGAHHDPHGDHKMGHRYLDGGLGRWTQPDPASDRLNPTQPGEASPYAYTGCDPINHTDPTGTIACYLGALNPLPIVGGDAGSVLFSAGGAMIGSGTTAALASAGKLTGLGFAAAGIGGVVAGGLVATAGVAAVGYGLWMAYEECR